MRALQPLALGVGPAELEAPLRMFEVKQRGAMPWLSANVRPESPEQSLPRSFLRSFAGMKLGFTSAMLPEAATSTDAVVVLEHGPAVASEVDALLQEDAHAVVVLAYMRQKEADALADVVPRASVVLHRGPEGVHRRGGVLVAGTANGSRLGRLRFERASGDEGLQVAVDYVESRMAGSEGELCP